MEGVNADNNEDDDRMAEQSSSNYASTASGLFERVTLDEGHYMKTLRPNTSTKYFLLH